MIRWKSLAVAALLVPMIGALRAQDQPKGQDPGKSTDDRMPQFQPGKEHQLLKQFDGEWEFKSKCSMPGQETMEGQGTESSRFAFGGFWLEIEEKGMMKNKDWSGKGLMGFDPQKKKYCGVWVDSWSPFIGKFEGEADSSGKVFTFKFMMSEEQKAAKTSAKDAETPRKDTGKEYGKDLGKDAGMKCPDRMVHEIKDQDHRTLKFYGKDDSGKEQLWTEITYTRKPAMVK